MLFDVACRLLRLLVITDLILPVDCHSEVFCVRLLGGDLPVCLLSCHRKPEYEQDQLKAAIESANILSDPLSTDNSWSSVPAPVMMTMLPKPTVNLSAADRMLAEVSATKKSEPAAELSAAERMLAEMSLGTPAVSAPAVTKSTATALIVGNSTSELAEQLQRVCDTVVFFRKWEHTCPE